MSKVLLILSKKTINWTPRAQAYSFTDILGRRSENAASFCKHSAVTLAQFLGSV